MRSETGSFSDMNWVKDGRVTCLMDWYQISKYSWQQVYKSTMSVNVYCTYCLHFHYELLEVSSKGADVAFCFPPFQLRSQPRKNSGQCVSAPEVIWSSRVPQRLGRPFGSPVVWQNNMFLSYLFHLRSGVIEFLPMFQSKLDALSFLRIFPCIRAKMFVSNKNWPTPSFNLNFLGVKPTRPPPPWKLTTCNKKKQQFLRDPEIPHEDWTVRVYNLKEERFVEEFTDTSLVPLVSLGWTFAVFLFRFLEVFGGCASFIGL